MAIENPIFIESRFRAFADLSTKQYYFVKLTANGIEIISANTDKPFGVLQNNPTAGQPAEVMRLGVTKVISTGVIAVGATIGVDSGGKAESKTLGTSTTQFNAGNADEAAAANDIFTASINCINPSRCS